MNFNFFILILSVLCSFQCFSNPNKLPRNVYDIDRIAKSYKKKQLEQNLRDFVANTRPSRLVGTPGHAKAIQWIENSIKKIGNSKTGTLKVQSFDPEIEYATSLYKKDFEKQILKNFKPDHETYKRWDSFTKNMVKAIESFKGVKGKNIIWEKKGAVNPEKVIIIGAHYDTIAHNDETMQLDLKAAMPGADDNGAAIAVMLGLIDIFSKYDFPKTVRIVFFDYEEIGFLGSRAYLKENLENLKKEKVAGYINLEMLGNDTKTSDKEKKYGNMKMYIRSAGKPGHDKDKALGEMLSVVGKRVAPSITFKLLGNDFNRSDNIHFWENDFAAVTLSQDWENDFNKHYHTPNDLPEMINFTTVHHTYTYLVGALMAWNMDLRK